jgi:hypothetical protein
LPSSRASRPGEPPDTDALTAVLVALVLNERAHCGPSDRVMAEHVTCGRSDGGTRELTVVLGR